MVHRLYRFYSLPAADPESTQAEDNLTEWESQQNMTYVDDGQAPCVVLNNLLCR